MSKVKIVCPAFYRCCFTLLLMIIASQFATAQPAPQSAPEVIHVELLIGDGTRSAYHIGEIVPVKLTFTSNAHTMHWVSAEGCEMAKTYPVVIPSQKLAGRGAQERTAHPFEGFPGCTEHGWGQNVDLSQRPVSDVLTLNRRYLLDTPESYSLTWTGTAYGQQVTSNVATLTLLPRDPAWEASELARADALLNLPDSPTVHYYDGCQMLQYLGTPAAALDMAHRYAGSRGRCGNEFVTPLVNASNRRAVLHVLEEKLRAPEFDMSEGFLRTVALLSIYQTHPEWYTAMMQQPNGVNPAVKALPSITPDALKEAEQRYIQIIAASLPTRTEAAQASCIMALLRLSNDASAPELSPQVIALIQKQLPDAIEAMHPADQPQILSNYWLHLAGPGMLPLLTRILDEGRYADLRGPALRHLIDLAPDKAREIVLREIRATYSSIPARDLGLLPDSELPQLDTLLLQEVIAPAADENRNTRHAHFYLLRRYASPAIAPQIEEFFTRTRAISLVVNAST